MSDNVKLLCPRGKTYYGGQATPPATITKIKNLLGQTGRFKDTDPVAANRANSSSAVLTGMWCYAIFVKNTTGATLTPGLPVKWKAGAIGSEIAVVTTDKDPLAGIVDDHLPIGSGCPADDCCWVFFKGPQLCDGDAGLTAGQTVYVNETSSVIQVEDLAAGDDTADIKAMVGVTLEALDATATNKVRVLLDIRTGY